jgi:hypothetical protein
MKGSKRNASDATKDETRIAKKECKIAGSFNGIILLKQSMYQALYCTC